MMNAEDRRAQLRQIEELLEEALTLSDACGEHMLGAKLADCLSVTCDLTPSMK